MNKILSSQTIPSNFPSLLWQPYIQSCYLHHSVQQESPFHGLPKLRPHSCWPIVTLAGKLTPWSGQLAVIIHISIPLTIAGLTRFSFLMFIVWTKTFQWLGICGDTDAEIMGAMLEYSFSVRKWEGEGELNKYINCSRRDEERRGREGKRKTERRGKQNARISPSTTTSALGSSNHWEPAAFLGPGAHPVACPVALDVSLFFKSVTWLATTHLAKSHYRRSWS